MLASAMARSGSETDEGSASAERTPHPPSLSRRHLVPQGEKGSERIAQAVPPARHTRASISLSLTYSAETRARQRDSKLSSSSIRACASIGSLRFSATTLTGGATLTLACAGSAAGHLSDDFEITVLPAYQHFRPSIRRQDQCPCAFDGEARHSLICALASAVSMPIGTSAEMQMAKKKTGRICIFIGHSPCG